MYTHRCIYLRTCIRCLQNSHRRCARERDRVSEWHMGWLRLVGSLKLQVSFSEYRLFYRALLQKRRVILRSLLMVATPYRAHRTFSYIMILTSLFCHTMCVRACECVYGRECVCVCACKCTEGRVHLIAREHARTTLTHIYTATEHTCL